MIHGNKSRFAIEWELDAEPGTLMFGAVCYWVGNIRVGNFDLGTELADVLTCLKYLVSDCGKRDSDRFCIRAAKDIFEVFSLGLFDGDSTLAKVVDDESWRRFDISIGVEPFNEWCVLLIDCRIHSRVIVGRFPNSDSTRSDFLMEQQLTAGEFDIIIKEFQNALEVAEQRLLGL